MLRIRAVRQYILFSALTRIGVFLVGSVYSPYLKAHGLDTLQVHMVNLSFFLTMLVAEVPTGAIADLIGRKRCVQASYFLLMVATATYGLATGFWGFVCAEILSGLGSSLGNGAFQAWVVSELNQAGHAHEKSRAITLQALWVNVGGIIGSVAGGYLAHYDLRYPWFGCAAISGLILLMACFYMKEDHRKQHTGFNDLMVEMADKIRTGLTTAYQCPELRRMLMMIFVMNACVAVANMGWTLWFGNEHFGLSSIQLGWLLGAMMATLLFGSWLAHLVGSRIAITQKDSARTIRVKNLEELYALFSTLLVAGIGIFLTTTLRTLWPSVAAFLVHEVGRGMFPPLRDIYLNDRASETERATLLSIGCIPSHVGNMLGLFLSGLAVQHVSVQAGWQVSGGILAGSVLLFVLLHRRSG